MGKKLLMACANYWTSPFQVGSHHIAGFFLAKGWEVAFISDPISPLHLLGKVTPDLAERYRLYSHGGATGHGGNLWAYVPLALCTPHNKPLLKSGFVHKNWHKATCPDVVGSAKKKGFGNPDLLYIDSVAQHFWLDELNYGQAVFRVADNNSGFAKSTSAAMDSEKKIARQADCVVYSAAGLKDYVLALGPQKTCHLPNGVNFGHFHDAGRQVPLDLRDIPKPIAIYVGAMSEWFDYALLNEAAKKLSDVSFVLIGPDTFARSKINELPNVHLLGKRNYADIPRYLYSADVGIIPFDVNRYPELVNNINPLKLYEYMACGLPVVATRWRELINIGAPVFLANNQGEFATGISAALAEGKTNKDKYIAYAKGHDWQTQAAKLLQFLDIQ
jgi:glycosyltransferase involved in cell wall biosynthesis